MTHAWMGPLCLAAFLAACGTAPAETADDARPRPSTARITGAEHFHGRTSVLSVLQSRIAGMQVQRMDGGCPEITLRGRASLGGNNNPVIYVEGSRSANTCILEMLDPEDIDRVEVYPSGIAPGGRPPTSSTGLILVYLRRA
jgi:hypothetical protein